MEQKQSSISLANKLITILSSEEDKQSIINIQNALFDYQKLQEDQEMAVKDIIEQLTSAHEEAKSLNSATMDNIGSIDKINQLKMEETATTEQIDKLEKSVQELENISKEKEREEMNLKARNEEITIKKDDVLPKTKYYFSLYSNISHIRWDYNSKENEVKGFVASLNDVKPFCLDSSQNTKYYTANYLWDLIDA